MTTINPISVNQPQAITNFKGGEKVETEGNAVEQMTDAKSALTSQDEVVGRSQVNFKGVTSLSAKELNKIAKEVAINKLTPEEVKIGKQALVDTMNDYNCKTVSQLTNLIKKSIDESNSGIGDGALHQDIMACFNGHIKNINPEANVFKISSIIDGYIAN